LENNTRINWVFFTETLGDLVQMAPSSAGGGWGYLELAKENGGGDK